MRSSTQKIDLSVIWNFHLSVTVEGSRKNKMEPFEYSIFQDSMCEDIHVYNMYLKDPCNTQLMNLFHSN